ncbi:MAG: SurA N-terminal domain-containing protein [Proteobacteria bacterium]|jgi:hypothetical protein|nr:SurA N-terminal domain-containing protein [Pseudomonadota bacterium]
MSVHSLFVLVLSPLLFAQAPSPLGKVVIEAVAKVNNQVITSRDVEMNYWLEKAHLNGQAPTLSKETTELSIDSESFQQQLNRVVLEHLVSAEADNFEIAQVSRDEIQKRAKKLGSFLEKSEPWQKLAVKPQELEVVVSRNLRAETFLKFKTESSGITITDQEVKAYFDKNRVKFGNLPLSQYQKVIREHLTNEAVKERLADWFEVLKRKYQVQRLQKPS